MKEPNFIQLIMVHGATFNILPGAGRIWRVQREVPLFWAPMPYQKELADFLMSDKPLKLLHLGGRRSGKTHYAALAAKCYYNQLCYGIPAEITISGEADKLIKEGEENGTYVRLPHPRF